MTEHVVMFSGGVGSWAAAKRVAERHGTERLRLLFTDTLIEDEDLYRFLHEAAVNVGGELITIKDGRTPWEVFFDERMMGSTRQDPCSRMLKREMADTYLNFLFDPADTVVYVGIDWTEIHRFDDGNGSGIRNRLARAGWRCEAPLCERPYLGKPEVFEWLAREGIRRPRLYDMGFAHNNCGGFCVKAGQGHFAKLLRAMPERYRRHEDLELAFRRMTKKDVAILRDRRGGETKPLTLRDLRLRIEAGGKVDETEIGGCGCFVTEASE